MGDILNMESFISVKLSRKKLWLGASVGNYTERHIELTKLYFIGRRRCHGGVCEDQRR